MNLCKHLIRNTILNYDFSNLIKKLIMAFAFHQICNEERCSNTFLFRIPLTSLSAQGVCLLTEKKEKVTIKKFEKIDDKKFKEYILFFNEKQDKTLKDKKMGNLFEFKNSIEKICNWIFCWKNRWFKSRKV